MAEKIRLPGPGLAKTRGEPLVRRRIVHLIAASDGRLRELFDGADVVSEGEAREEGGALIYYGSTSLLLALGAGRLAPGEPLLAGALAALAPLDPHVRLRAVRIARREASARAGGPLGTMHAEVIFRGVADRLGSASAGAAATIVSVTVDVTAVVLRRSARSTMPP